MRLYLSFALFAVALSLHAETAVGDWGHFISYTPTVYLNNPEGKAFTVKVHVMQWGTRSWKRDKLKLHLAAPDGSVVFSGTRACEDATVTLEVPAGKPGVIFMTARAARIGL